MRPRPSSRREFLCVGVASVACACSGCGAFGSRKSDVVTQPTDGKLRLSKAQSAPLLQPPSSLLIEPAGVQDKILVVNHEGSLSALSAICTHKGCTVDYNKEAGRIDCPCHGSQFALDGRNLRGPAKSPLKQYPAVMENGQLVITL